MRNKIAAAILYDATIPLRGERQIFLSKKQAAGLFIDKISSRPWRLGGMS
jgi:hypothetical protein